MLIILFSSSARRGNPSALWSWTPRWSGPRASRLTMTWTRTRSSTWQTCGTTRSSNSVSLRPCKRRPAVPKHLSLIQSLRKLGVVVSLSLQRLYATCSFLLVVCYVLEYKCNQSNKHHIQSNQNCSQIYGWLPILLFIRIFCRLAWNPTAISISIR